MADRESAFSHVLAVSFAAGLATLTVVEVVVRVRRGLGVNPSNVAGHVALIWAASALSGLVIGARLTIRRPPLGELLGTGALAPVGWCAGIAAAEIALTLGSELLVGGERGMDLLTIPYVVVRGLLPLLVAMLISSAAGVLQAAVTSRH